MGENLPFLDRRMALCVVLPLVIVSSTTWWRWSGGAQRLHNEATQVLHSKGLADNLVSLTDRLRQTEDESKATKWKSVAKSIRYLPGPMQPVLGRVRTVVPPPGTEWELEPAAREFVDNHRPLLDELLELTQDPATLSLVPENGDLNEWLDSAADNLLVSAGLDMVGCIALRDNDEAGVLRTIQSMYECRRTLKSVAPALGAFVRFDFSQRGLFLLKMGLERGLFRKDSLDSLRQIMLEHIEVDSGWLSTVEFELAMHMDLMRGQAKLKRYPPDTNSTIATRLSSYILPSASPLDRVRFLKLIQNLAEASTGNLAAFQSAQLECDVLFAELRNASTRFDFSETGFAHDDNLADSFVADAMRHRLAAAAISVQLYHVEHGSYPKKLEELATLTDNEALQPLGGKPLGYAQVATSATIWIASESPWTTPVTLNGSQSLDQTVVWTLSSTE